MTLFIDWNFTCTYKGVKKKQVLSENVIELGNNTFGCKGEGNKENYFIKEQRLAGDADYKRCKQELAN